MSTAPVTEALTLCVATRTPVVLWGDPGTGKSSLMSAIAEALGDDCVFETIIASIHDPSDFSGLPIADGDVVHFAPPRWARDLAAAPRGLCFLDEISTAPPATQAALLRVVLEGVVGDLRLGNHVSFVAAANPPESSAGGWELTAPLANRFVHLDWEPDHTSIAEGLGSGFPKPNIPSGLGNLQIHPRVRGLVSGFLTKRPEHALKVPKDRAQAGRGYPTPRSWETVIRLYSAGLDVGVSSDAMSAAIVGAVGRGTAIEFLGYVDDAKLPDPELFLTNPNTPCPARGDLVVAVCQAVVSAVRANMTGERFAAGFDALAAIADQRGVGPATGAARTLAKARPDGVPMPASIKVFGPVLRDAGLID